MTERERLDSITESIIGDAIEVHRALGPGLLESAYNVNVLKSGIVRMVNNYPDSQRSQRALR